jgi:hypothetical protein
MENILAWIVVAVAIIMFNISTEVWKDYLKNG